MSAAIEAIRHILHRVQDDPDFAWHMVGTESLSRCVTAYAVHLGIDPDRMRSDLESNIAAMQTQKKTRIQSLEEQIDSLETQIDSLEETADEAEQSSSDLIHAASRVLSRALTQLASVKDLVQYCTFRNAPLSVAAVELALGGHSLGRCLQELESVGA
jgi:septal ring factor EnvC (AmiA/AmiB activator)